MEKAKILVVDDERGICQNVEKILAKDNYDVIQAASAKEALEKMAKESYALLISDIVMPGQNGLELLKMTKARWPLIKVVMMTAYASTDTAVKAIRLGALDYIPKPFTPGELREVVERALSGELVEAPVPENERARINVIDVDMPFEREEVAKVAGEGYADTLGPSDMPAVAVPSPETLPYFCAVGEMVCDIYKKLGNTCKGGVKTGACPQKKAGRAEGVEKRQGVPDRKGLIGIDQPFNYEEVVSVTGPQYVEQLHQEGVTFVPYEELKKEVARREKLERAIIDVDMPFERAEVEKYAGEGYAETLTHTDVPVPEVPSPETLPYYCAVGKKMCDIYKKLGDTCKAGRKTEECPQEKAKKKAVLGKGEAVIDPRKVIGPEQPFDYQEVVSATGPEYVQNLDRRGVLPYEELKARVGRFMEEASPEPFARVEKREAAAEETILIIDDEAAVNNNIRKILSRKGYRVEQAMTKKEALEKIAEKAYSLVLLDLKIPGVEGLELLKAVREKRPDTLVVIITGYASIETAVETARLGAVDYLPKPFTPDEIRTVTDRALQLAA